MHISEKSIRETIYDALVDCHNSTQEAVAREMLLKVTGIKPVIFDEQMRQLIDVDQTVIRKKRGLFLPALVFPESRAVSGTVLTSGMVKVEVGDHCMELTPAEARKLAPMLGGGAIAESEAIQQNRLLMAKYLSETKKNKRQISEILRFIRKNYGEFMGSTPQLKLELQ